MNINPEILKKLSPEEQATIATAQSTLGGKSGIALWSSTQDKKAYGSIIGEMTEMEVMTCLAHLACNVELMSRDFAKNIGKDPFLMFKAVLLLAKSISEQGTSSSFHRAESSETGQVRESHEKIAPIPPQKCPKCQKEVITHETGTSRPKVGTLALCANCLTSLRFDDKMILQELSEEEIVKLTPDELDGLEEFRSIITKHKREEAASPPSSAPADPNKKVEGVFVALQSCPTHGENILSAVLGNGVAFPLIFEKLETMASPTIQQLIGQQAAISPVTIAYFSSREEVQVIDARIAPNG